MRLLHNLPLIFLFFTELLFAANIESFNVSNLECEVGSEWGKINSIWSKDGVLTVTVQEYESTTRIRDTGEDFYVVGDNIYLIYDTYNPYKSGDPIPACVFPVELTYKIAGLAHRDYHFTVVTSNKIKIYSSALAALLGCLWFFGYRLSRRRKKNK